MAQEANTKSVREGVVVIPFRDRESGREYLCVKTMPGNMVWVTGGTDGEPFDVAARRELKEETGLEAEQLIATDLTHTFNYAGTEDPGFQRVFIARVSADGTLTLPPEEILEAKWIHAEEVEKTLTFPAHATLFTVLHDRGLV